MKHGKTLLPVIVTVFAAGMLLHALIAAAPAHASNTKWAWQVPIGEAWEYGASWHWNPDTGRIQGYLTPQIIIESVEDGVIKGGIATPSGTILPVYGNDSRLLVTFGYDSGGSSRQFLSTPENGEFSIKIPDEYSDADYVKIFVNSHSFNIKPSGKYPESGVSTIIQDGPTNKTSTVTFATDDGLEGTIKTLVTEESTTTTDVNVGEKSVVTVKTIKSFVTETTTVTTPKPAKQINAADEETTSESSTTSNTRSTTSTSADKKVTTVTDVSSIVSSRTEVTSTNKSATKITTVNTNSTKVITETVSLAFKDGHITVWDNHKHFKIDGYYVFDGKFKKHTFYQPEVRVLVAAPMTEYRLGQ